MLARLGKAVRQLCGAGSPQATFGGARGLLGPLPGCRGLTSTPCPAAAASPGFVTLNSLADNPRATKQAKRVGRGIGSGRGKTAGRGHKGQKARTGRKPKPGFEGGQTPMRQRVPRRGFHNPFSREYAGVNVGRLQQLVDAGRLDPGRVVTMRALVAAGAAPKRLADGVKLLGRGADTLGAALHLQVSQASPLARMAIERAGGSVTTVYYSQLGLRALLKPDWFAAKGRLLPRPAHPPPKLAPRFEAIGALPPDLALPPAGQGKPAIDTQPIIVVGERRDSPTPPADPP